MDTLDSVLVVLASANLGMAVAALSRTPQWPFDGTQACLMAVGFSTGLTLGIAILCWK